MPWATILGLIQTVLGWFGVGQSKSDAEVGLDSGEKLGVAETKEAAENKELQDVQKSQNARNAVSDDPAAVVSDPNNLG